MAHVEIFWKLISFKLEETSYDYYIIYKFIFDYSILLTSSAIAINPLSTCFITFSQQANYRLTNIEISVLSIQDDIINEIDKNDNRVSS